MPRRLAFAPNDHNKSPRRDVVHLLLITPTLPRCFDGVLRPSAAYYDLESDFRQVSNEVDQDCESFYKAVERIAARPKREYRSSLADIP